MTSTAKPTLNPNLREFWTTKARNKILYGGRDSSKTWDAAGFAIFLASKYTVRFLCTRQFQNKIEESVYTTLKTQIKRFGLQDEFTILNNKIIHKITGSEFVFYGLWRNIDEIKSLEGIDICWIEEAHNLTKEQWDILEPTIRKEGSEFWIIFNPKLLNDFVYQRFVVNPPPNTLVRKINYTENPFLSETSKSIIKSRYEEDPEDAEHIYGGEPKQDDNDSIIKRSWVLACIDAHEKLNIDNPSFTKIGFDVADDGADKNAVVLRTGFICTYIEEWKAEEHELLKSAQRVYNLATSNNRAHITYDSVGVGASMGAKFIELNNNIYDRNQHIKFNGFSAGDGVINPDDEYKHGKTNKQMFSGIKSQAWWDVADRIKATYNAVQKGTPISADQIISIDSSLPQVEQLINELTTPKKDYDNFDRVKVESKKDLKKRKVNSPNIADAFIMCYFNNSSQNILLASMQD